MGSGPKEKRKINKRFNTQKEMLKHYNPDAEGVCAQVTNTVMRTLIEGEDPKYLESEEQTYEQVVKEAKIQEELLNNGNSDDAKYSAFETTKTPYAKKEYTYEEITDPKKLRQKIGESRYGLFSTPTGAGKRRHLTGLYQDPSNERCGLIDPDLPGGHYQGSCDEVIKAFAGITKLHYSKDTSQTTQVGLSL